MTSSLLASSRRAAATLRCFIRPSSSTSTAEPSSSSNDGHQDGASTSSSSPGASSKHKPSSRQPENRRAPQKLVEAATRPRPFKYTDALVRYLRESMILHEPGRFVILQKPYGVSCLGFKQKDGGVFKGSVHNAVDQDEDAAAAEEGVDSGEERRRASLDAMVTIADAIPQLSQLLKEPQLGFATGIKRYASGPLILPCSKTEYNHMVECLKRGTATDDVFVYSALAICVGKPREREGTLSGYATFAPGEKFEFRDEVKSDLKEFYASYLHVFYKYGTHKLMYVFVEGVADKRQRTGKYAVQGELAWRTLATGHDCSLVHFQCSKFARHLPRLALAHIDAPILGDAMYLKRVFDVDGAPVRMEPAKAARNTGKKYTPAGLTRLSGLGPEELGRLPLYLHVWQTVLPRYGSPRRREDRADLVASAPPPSHFESMVELLGFSRALHKFWREEQAADAEE